MLEFTFCMIIVFLMMFSLIMIFRWSGADLGQRRVAHDTLLINSIVEDYNIPSEGPLSQIDPYFYQPVKMNAVWDGN